MEEKLKTMADLQAFLKASGCRMTVGAQGQQWAAIIYQGSDNIATAVDEAFEVAVRDACTAAEASIQKQRLTHH